MNEIKSWQKRLNELGENLTIDGDFGPATLAASLRLASKIMPAPLPWVAEGMAVIGLHEHKDNAKLRAWLKTDGATLGDPAALPWCGDFVETCIKRALPHEQFPGNVGANPYFARNWREFGQAVDPTYGAIMVFERGPNAGHVGFCMGEVTQGNAYAVLGGNQGDRVSIVPVAKNRLLACRWPATYLRGTINLPRMTLSEVLSTNEA